MELYAFGSNSHSLIEASCDGNTPRSTTLTPQRILHGSIIEIVWASWCQSIVLFNDQILYSGMGITRDQLRRISEVYRNRPLLLFGAEMQEGLRGAIQTETPATLTFFANEEEIMDGTPAVDTYQQHLHGDMRFQHISITSGGVVNIAANTVKKSHDSNIETPVHSCIIQIESLAELKVWMDNNEIAPPRNIIQIPTIEGWKHVVSNAISCTALTFDGEIYTWATDRRFPECLGRDTEEAPAEVPSRIPYFSETKIVKVAAGGFMTAAVSEDGELFLWGRSCPGANGELSLFETEHGNEDTPRGGERSPSDWRSLLSLRPPSSQRPSNSQPSEQPLDPERTKRKRENVSGSRSRTALALPPPKFPTSTHPDESATEPAQAHSILPQREKKQEQPSQPQNVDDSSSSQDTYTDRYIKLAEISLHGHAARITDVAVGNGHVLVAAEAVMEEGEVLRGVFAAGQANHGQLGLGEVGGFVGDFTEIEEFAGRKVRQLVAAGWVSWVVVEGEAGG